MDSPNSSRPGSCRGEPPEAVYSFKHALVRDAAYEHSITLRAAARDADDWGPFSERVHAEKDNGAALGIGWMGAATQGGGRRHRARDNASRARLAFSRA